VAAATAFHWVDPDVGYLKCASLLRAAGWLALPDDVREELLDDVATLARDRFSGIVIRPYQTVLYLAQRFR
jgi:hypothetical protein